MKKQFSFFLLLFFFSNFLVGQNGVWTWMHGISGNNSLGTFGTQGVAAPTNNPPGLYEAANWTDNNGNFWILGGNSANTCETALWKFDPLTNMWTWMKGPGTYQQPGVYGTLGVPSPANYPGSREFGSATWTDNQNNLWIFGGFGYDMNGAVGRLNDLWMYNITTNEWTWMKGSNLAHSPGSYGIYQVPSSTNEPPSRFECTATWTDQNNDLWFIGGCTDTTYSSFGDMWRYSISTNEWTWMKGTSTLNALPYYGTKGLPTSLNFPGGRCYYSHWKDNDGNFWTYGGAKYDTTFNGTNVAYADMWRFNPLTLEWTWMAGSNIPNDASSFTEKCISSQEYPESTSENKSGWTDECGRFWSISGAEDLQNTFLCQNDLWVFDPGTNHFTWVSGTGLPNQPANYGTVLIPSPTNYPGAMDGACSFKDQQGNFWLFAGQQGPPNYGLKNTLWKYVPDTDCVKYTTRTLIYHNDNVCAGTPIDFSIDLNGAYSYQWDFGDPSSTNNSSTQAAPSHTYSSPGIYYATLYFTPQITTCRSAEIATTQITILDDISSMLFPNVFTPNADNTNDIFPDIRSALDNYHLQIFNRWGQLVFETSDTQNNWDGKLNGKQCPAGVYYWIATVSDCSGKPKERNGYVELIL